MPPRRAGAPHPLPAGRPPLFTAIRIGPLFLRAGLGWGGSCFPKDLEALVHFARSKDVALPLVDATLQVNEFQPLRAVQLAEGLLGSLRGKRVAVLGLAFKPQTDDMRGAVSIALIDALLARGAEVSAYDPAATTNARRIWGRRIHFARTARACLQAADCCIVVTEWEEFTKLAPDDFLSRMRTPIVIDARRIFDPREFSRKLRYVAIGLGSASVEPHTLPDERAWRNPALAVNAIIEDRKRVLLVKRRVEPFEGLWSLPGGYVEDGESVEHALAREVREECGLNIQPLGPVGVYSEPRRHPWKHVVALCYAARITRGKVKAGAEETAARFFPVEAIPHKLAFDHGLMLRDYFARRTT